MITAFLCDLVMDLCEVDHLFSIKVRNRVGAQSQLASKKINLIIDREGTGAICVLPTHGGKEWGWALNTSLGKEVAELNEEI